MRKQRSLASSSQTGERRRKQHSLAVNHSIYFHLQIVTEIIRKFSWLLLELETPPIHHGWCKRYELIQARARTTDRYSPRKTSCHLNARSFMFSRTCFHRSVNDPGFSWFNSNVVYLSSPCSVNSSSQLIDLTLVSTESLECVWSVDSSHCTNLRNWAYFIITGDSWLVSTNRSGKHKKKKTGTIVSCCTMESLLLLSTSKISYFSSILLLPLVQMFPCMFESLCSIQLQILVRILRNPRYLCAYPILQLYLP